MVGPSQPGTKMAKATVPKSKVKDGLVNIIVVGGICLTMALPITAGSHFRGETSRFELNPPLTSISSQMPGAN